jgi:hypothetical protein
MAKYFFSALMLVASVKAQCWLESSGFPASYTLNTNNAACKSLDKNLIPRNSVKM